MLVTYLLILATWVLWIGAFAGLGLIALQPFARSIEMRDRVDAGLWLGLALTLLFATAASLVGPLGGTLGILVCSVVCVVGWAVLIVVVVRHGGPALRSFIGSLSVRRIPTLITVGLLGLALLLLVRFAAAAPMDADAGLYRLGAINYASSYGTVPGLANLHDRFGFNSSLWPFAATVGNGLWANQGFRLVGGLFVAVLLVGTALRLLVPRRKGPSSGDWFFVSGTAFTLAMILTDSGRWVPSPPQDLTILVLGVASTAFLLDFVQRSDRQWTGAMAVIMAAAAGSIRPLGWVLLAVTVAIVAWLTWWRRRGTERALAGTGAYLAAPVALCALLVGAMLIRDAILSGWLLFPLSAFPVDVPWQAPNPKGLSEWVTSWGRAPNQPKDVVLASNEWFGPWFTEFRSSRPVYLELLMGIGLVIPLAWASGRRAWRRMLVNLPWAWGPTLAVGVAWFITAPDVRFGWVALVGLAGVPLALLLAFGAYPAFPLRIVGALILLLMVASNVLNSRLAPRGNPPEATTLTWGPISIDVALGPVPEAVTSPGELRDGTPITFGSNGWCWNEFPLCVLEGGAQDVYRLGPSISDGFAWGRPQVG